MPKAQDRLHDSPPEFPPQCPRPHVQLTLTRSSSRTSRGSAEGAQDPVQHQEDQDCADASAAQLIRAPPRKHSTEEVPHTALLVRLCLLQAHCERQPARSMKKPERDEADSGTSI